MLFVVLHLFKSHQQSLIARRFLLAIIKIKNVIYVIWMSRALLTTVIYTYINIYIYMFEVRYIRVNQTTIMYNAEQRTHDRSVKRDISQPCSVHFASIGLYVIVILVRHNKAHFDTNSSAQKYMAWHKTHKCPVRHKNAIPNIYQLPLPLAQPPTTPPYAPPIKNW